MKSINIHTNHRIYLKHFEARLSFSRSTSVHETIELGDRRGSEDGEGVQDVPVGAWRLQVRQLRHPPGQARRHSLQGGAPGLPLSSFSPFAKGTNLHHPWRVQAFQSRSGKAYLFEKVVNVTAGPKEVKSRAARACSSARHGSQLVLDTGQDPHHGTAHGGRRVLQRLPGLRGVEVRGGLRGEPKVQGGQIHPREGQGREEDDVGLKRVRGVERLTHEGEHVHIINHQPLQIACRDRAFLLFLEDK